MAGIFSRIAGAISLSDIVETFKSIGEFTLEKGMAFARLMSDPRKGYLVSIASYYLLNLVNLNVKAVEDQIENIAKSVESFDPTPMLKQWIEANTGIRESDLLNVTKFWETTPPSGADPLSLVARAIVFPFRTLAIYILWGLYYVVYYILLGIRWLGSAFLRYVVKPLASFILNVIRDAMRILRFLICLYISFGTYYIPAQAFFKGLYRGFLRALGLSIMEGLLTFFTTSFVAPECVMPPMNIAYALSMPQITVTSNISLSITASADITITELLKIEYSMGINIISSAEIYI
jgi:hypothetical protein